MIIAELREWLAAYNVQAFLRAIRLGESSPTDDEAYRALFGWRPGNGKVFATFSDHPRVRTYERADEFIRNGKKDYTTAAGAYQITETTWNGLVRQYGFADFSPENQDLAAVALIRGRGAIPDLLRGDLRAAIRKCTPEWASLPGATTGQPTKKYEQTEATYLNFGGALAPQTQEVNTMVPVPIIAAGISVLRDLIPSIASIFKPESEVAARNVQAATAIFDAVSKATDSPNVQAAIEKMQGDPAALAAAKAAVNEIIPQLVEAGGGGIDGARKASAAPDQLPFWKQPAFVFLALVLPLVYMLAVSVLFNVGGVEWSGEVRVMVATGFIGLLGAGSAFFWGSSLGSQKKDSLLSKGDR